MSQNAKYFDMRTSYDQVGDRQPYYVNNGMDPSVNNILASVHQRLKYNPHPSVPKIPKAIADTMPRKVPEVLLMESPVKTKTKQRNFNRNSIQQLQADREFKSMTQARRFGATSDMMSFQNQKRYRELLCQKRILEEMLKEHQKLQSDRDNIASEINYMRSYLDNIRNKLDVSLRKLNSHKTIAEIEPEKRSMNRSQPQIRRNCQRHAQSVRNASARVRMAGGFDTPISKSRISALSTLKNVNTQKAPAVKTVIKQRKPAQCKGPKQWVYCTRIDRKDYVKSIFI